MQGNNGEIDYYKKYVQLAEQYKILCEEREEMSIAIDNLSTELRCISGELEEYRERYG